ncbi:MAG: DUF5711 family protein [Defluviitaleaceae bacterium]|nr:DUF5711 family protein [Defluviitaleaceae bacterium]
MSKKGVVLIGIIIIAIAFLAQSVFGLSGFGASNMRLVNTDNGVSFAFDSNPSFHSNGGRFFYFVTRTGVRYVNDRGESRWSESFTITRPHMATRGDMVAVGEADSGRAIYVYNSEGHLYTQNLDHPARGFYINAAGDLAVIVQLDSGFEVSVYNQLRHYDRLFGTQISQTARPMHIPVVADVSECGRFVAIAYLDFDRHLSTLIEFWPIGNAPWGTDGLFAQMEFPGEGFINMRFMTDNNVLIITDSRITLQRIVGNALEEVWTEPLHNRLDQLAFCGNNRFAFAAGAPSTPDGRYADPLGTVNIFDISGQTGSFQLGRRITHLSMGNNAVIVGADRHFHAVNATGNSLWYYNAIHDVRDIIFLNDTDTVIIAGPNRAYIWRRQRIRD